MVYLSHTKHSNDIFFCLLQSCYCTGKTLPHHTVLLDPPHTVNPTINILSAHAHGKGLGTTQKIGTSGESRPPKHHTPQALCRFWHDFFCPRKTFQGEVLEATGWGAKWHALAGTRTLLPWPSLSLEAVLAAGFTLCSLRGASSCAGPGGRTWRNTCHSENI